MGDAYPEISEQKDLIEKDIQEDFIAAYNGIINLPKGSRKGVYLAYIYYLKFYLTILLLAIILNLFFNNSNFLYFSFKFNLLSYNCFYTNLI